MSEHWRFGGRPAAGPAVVDFWKLASLLPKQIRFLRLSTQHRFMLYGGARGGGKSRLLRWGLLWLLLEWHQRFAINGVNVVLMCEDYPQLEKRQIGKIKLEFPRWLGELKTTRHLGLGFYLKEEYGGGVLLLANLDDPSKYLSAEFAAIAVDELTKNPVDIFHILRGSLRWPGISRTCFWGATNPGGVGHPWVKSFWIDREYPPELAKQAHEFGFVQSLPADNPHLDQTYWDDLMSMPEQIRKAWVEGLWDSFIGQAFDEWRPSLHVKAYEPPDDWWPAAGMDWGYDRPGWFGLSYWGPERRHHWRWEYYFGRGTENGPMTPYDVGFAIGHGLQRFRPPPQIVLDSACFADTFQGQAHVSDASEIQRGLNAAWAQNIWDVPQVVPSAKGPGSRATRKTLMHEGLAWRPGPDPLNPTQNIPKWHLPKMTVHPDCKHLIRTIPLLVVEEDEPSKIDKDCEDHCFDGATYASMSQHAGFLEEETVPAGTGILPGLDEYGQRLPHRYRFRDAMERSAGYPRWSNDVRGEGSSLEGFD